MKALQFSAFGDPAEVLSPVEVPTPEPGPGQVRVRLVMSPIHNHDLMIVAGKYGYKPELPHVPGTESVGVVEALGEGVTNLSVGQRVTGGANTWAESYLVEAARAIAVPDSIDDETACQMISMPLSAKMVLHQFGAKAGDWVIQNAGNGAVAKMVAQFGAEAGINVINLVRRDEGIAELADAGIQHAVSTASADWRDKVAEITKGASIGFGIESIGGEATNDLLDVMGENSFMYSFGSLTGAPMQISASNLLFKQQRVEGFWLGRLMQTAAPEVTGKLIGEIVTAAATGKLKLAIGGSYGLEQASEAMTAAVTPGRAGKIVLTR
ncbi:zinc-binding dehydrogenase [Devosia sp.]|uniref:zinc-binding dehydrogenase n=1 Tax=Devosia sp. TaxID=1871048 RepID=UPI003A926B4B